MLPPCLLVGKGVSLVIGPLIEGGGSVLRRRVLGGQPIVALPVASVIPLFVALIIALPETLGIALIVALIAVTATRSGGAVGPCRAAGLRIAVEIGILLPVVAGCACLGTGPLVGICGPHTARTGAVFGALASVMLSRICTWMLSRM